MKLQHIISTMHRTEFSFLSEMNLKRDALVINQAEGRGDITFLQDDIEVRAITTDERGLSRSRNMLLDNAECDVAILGDDDLYYLDGYEKIIEDAYARHPDADIIAFRFTTEMGKETRRQFDVCKKLGVFGISKIASVEITFKPRSVRDKGIRFDTLLGLGAEFGSGEENAFLADALRAGLVIWYEPMTICYLKPDPEDRKKWKDGFNEDYFVNKGACFYRIYKGLFLPFAFAFVLLKKRNIFKGIPLFWALRRMIKGKGLYKQKTKEE